MKTAEQFFKETIAEYNKNATPMNVFSFSKKESELFIDMIEEYAKQCCEEQKLQCADNAKVIAGNLLERTPHNKHFWNMKHNLFVEADRESILNTPNVVTTK